MQAVDDLASVYTAWAEMELRHENYDKALEVRPQPMNHHVHSLLFYKSLSVISTSSCLVTTVQR